MRRKDTFINLVKEKFEIDARKVCLPDQSYINRLIASLDRVEANSYNNSQIGFISEYKYLKGVDVSLSISDFVEGCLNQLLWINSILESNKYADTIEDLDKYFDYNTPSMLGDSWTLDKVSKKGVFFRGAEPFQDSRVIINSENILEITIALYEFLQHNGEVIVPKKNVEVKSVVISGPIKLTEEEKIKNYCMKLLKEKLYAPNNL